MAANEPAARVIAAWAKVTGVAFGFGLLALAVLDRPALSQGPRDMAALIARGREIASGRCVRCHAVARQGESPQKGVIAFRDLHTRFPIEMLLEARQTGIVKGHDEMPMTALGRGDADALLALIDNLSPAGAPRYLGK